MSVGILHKNSVQDSTLFFVIFDLVESSADSNSAAWAHRQDFSAYDHFGHVHCILSILGIEIRADAGGIIRSQHGAAHHYLAG